MSITGTPRPQDPIISRADTGDTVVRAYTYGPHADWQSEMPDVGDPGGVGTAEEGLYFAGFVGRPGTGGIYIDVDLTYGPADLAANSPNQGAVWGFDARGDETPIEKHASFLMHWAYALYAIDALGDSAPIWYLTATDASDANGYDYQWSKYHPGPGWVKVGERSKPGVESWITPRTIIYSEFYYSSRSSATAARKDVGTLETPSELFGISGGSWLIVSSTINDGGRYWITRNEYLHAPGGAYGIAGGWDTDIYN